jgi:hypothetical protein
LPRLWPQQLLEAEEFAFLVNKQVGIVNIAHKLLQFWGGEQWEGNWVIRN